MSVAYAERSPQAALNLLLDGRKLGDGGIGVYIENIVLGLLPRSDVNLTVISSERKAQNVAWHDQVSWIHDEAKQYSLDEMFLLARRIDWKAFDLYHAPHFTLPFGIPIPSVVTIHDLIHIDYPESFYYPGIARRLIRSAVRRATAVLAVSNATKCAVEALTGVESSKVSVIPNAIPPFLEQNEQAVSVSTLVRECLVKQPFFVAVLSNLKPHKGALDLLLAYQQASREFEKAYSERTFPNLLLVGYGARDIERDTDLHQLAQETKGVTVIGAVSPAELTQLYRAAQAVVVPSIAEGFCLPALEAQSVGAQVVCRPVPALVELVTQSDLVAADLSRESFAEVLKRAAFVDPRGTKGVNQAHLDRFSLTKVSEQLYGVYSAVVTRQGAFSQQQPRQRGV
jgi:glycosyltransferase involved in cell wall biosynthesis